jgi:hypothetical protein
VRAVRVECLAHPLEGRIDDARDLRVAQTQFEASLTE